MQRENKTIIIDQLKEVLSECSIGILTDYRGLTAAEITELRRKLGESGISYRVVKNTLARFAAERAGKDELVSLFDGPVAIASGYGNITEPARALADYIRTSKVSLTIKGGFLGNSLLTSEEVIALSSLPSREILLARVVGGMQIPILALVSHLTTPMKGLVGIMQARIKQLEGE